MLPNLMGTSAIWFLGKKSTKILNYLICWNWELFWIINLCLHDIRCRVILAKNLAKRTDKANLVRLLSWSSCWERFMVGVIGRGKRSADFYLKYLLPLIPFRKTQTRTWLFEYFVRRLYFRRGPMAPSRPKTNFNLQNQALSNSNKKGFLSL